MAKKKEKNAGHVKDPNAAALGRKGGKIGGRERAKKLGAQRRSEIAKEGGIARGKQVKEQKKREGKK